MTFVTRKALNRRMFLRSAGVAVGLPLFDAMLPAFAPSDAPAVKRLVFVYAPNGVMMQHWTPASAAPGFELPSILAPLEAHRDRLTIFSGLALNGGRPLGDGAGDHARAAASFLTGAHPRKTAATNLQNGPSVDQIAAQGLKGVTPFPSLELGCEPGGIAGECDSGYSCAYSNNISWLTASNPMPPETNPRLVFERLFSGYDASGDPAARARKARQDKSILDFVLDDTAKLQLRLGDGDRRKLDEYLSAIREIEQRIDLVAHRTQSLPSIARPVGIPETFAEHARLMFNLLTVAFQADLTRVATFMLTREGSGFQYPELGFTDGHHPLTHHTHEEGPAAKILAINRHHTQQLRYFLDRLAAASSGTGQASAGSLLDQTTVLYGSGLSDGNKHRHDDLPILLFQGPTQGGAQRVARRAEDSAPGRGVPGGKHVRFSEETPLARLYLRLLGEFGTPALMLGDALEPLPTDPA
jgi:hypothetical protein